MLAFFSRIVCAAFGGSANCVGTVVNDGMSGRLKGAWL